MEENNKKVIKEASAAEKYAFEKDGGAMVARSEMEKLDREPSIKVTIEINGEVNTYDLQTLLFIGFEKGMMQSSTEHTSGQSTAVVTGKYSPEYSLAMIQSIEKTIEATPQLGMAKMLYRMKSGGVILGGLDGIFGGME